MQQANAESVDLDTIIEILKKKVIDRSATENEKLIQLIASIRFFSENIELKMSPEDFFQYVPQYLKYERFERNEFIYHHTHPADKFYILLKGLIRSYELRPQKEVEAEIMKKNAKNSPNRSLLKLDHEEARMFKVNTIQTKPLQRAASLSAIPESLKEKIKDRFGKMAHQKLITRLKEMRTRQAPKHMTQTSLISIDSRAIASKERETIFEIPSSSQEVQEDENIVVSAEINKTTSILVLEDKKSRQAEEKVNYSYL